MLPPVLYPPAETPQMSERDERYSSVSEMAEALVPAATPKSADFKGRFIEGLVRESDSTLTYTSSDDRRLRV